MVKSKLSDSPQNLSQQIFTHLDQKDSPNISRMILEVIFSKTFKNCQKWGPNIQDFEFHFLMEMSQIKFSLRFE